LPATFIEMADAKLRIDARLTAHFAAVIKGEPAPPDQPGRAAVDGLAKLRQLLPQRHVASANSQRLTRTDEAKALLAQQVAALKAAIGCSPQHSAPAGALHAGHRAGRGGRRRRHAARTRPWADRQDRRHRRRRTLRRRQRRQSRPPAQRRRAHGPAHPALHGLPVGLPAHPRHAGLLHERLVARGKPPKVALAAVMHKMTARPNAMAHTGQEWDETHRRAHA